MSKYKRIYQPKGLYFFTVVTYQRRPLFSDTQYIKRLKYSFQYCNLKYPFKVIALVILPDHLHTIWHLPENDYEFSLRWKTIKNHFSRGFDVEKNVRGEKKIWQRRFWEHLIRDEKDFENHINYIYYNPVKHGLVGSVKEWPYSTFHRDVEKGLFDSSWGEGISSAVLNLDLE